MKTASDLFNEFYDKPAIERVNRAVQNYVFDYQQAIINELQKKINVYELHINSLKGIHENYFNEKSESSYILGNLDGFFECIESDLKGEIK